MNIGVLAKKLGLEEDEFLELVELFVETGISDLDKLQSAIAEGNADKAANAAHSLRGAAVSLGFVELSEIARKIEEDARNDRLETIAEAAQALQGKLDIIVDSLRR